MCTHRSPRHALAATLFVSLLVLVACGEDTIDGPDPLGSVAVIVQTSGATAEATLDPDGYSVTMGDQSASVPPNGTVTFTGLAAGSYQLSLVGLEANCTTRDSPLSVTVAAGATVNVTCEVTCWPPTVGRIVFSSNRDGAENLFSMNADGTEVVQVTNGGSAFWPSWSPDGWRIAYTQGGGNEDIVVINADGSGGVHVTSDPLPEEGPTWSPDGSRVAFARYTPPISSWNPEDIYVADADGGGNEVRLTSDPARDFLPVWSPDGSRILFTTERDGNAEVYVMNADGSDPVNLTNHPAADVAWPGAWSPDGTRIAFNSNRTGDDEVYVMNADGSDPRNLTDSPFNERGGAWSPDGTRLVFSRHPLGNIFVMNADGTGVVDITDSGPVLDRYPHWSWGMGDVGVTARKPRGSGPLPGR